MIDLLVYMYEQGEPVSTKEMCEALMVSNPTEMALIRDEYVIAGLIKKLPHRAHEVMQYRLTSSGTALAERRIDEGERTVGLTVATGRAFNLMQLPTYKPCAYFVRNNGNAHILSRGYSC